MADLSLIKKIARQQGLSITELSNIVGLSETGLHKLIRENSTTIKQLESISAALKVSPAIFFEEQGVCNDEINIVDERRRHDEIVLAMQHTINDLLGELKKTNAHQGLRAEGVDVG